MGVRGHSTFRVAWLRRRAEKLGGVGERCNQRFSFSCNDKRIILGTIQ